jgi:hypothetical protein
MLRISVAQVAQKIAIPIWAGLQCSINLLYIHFCMHYRTRGCGFGMVDIIRTFGLSSFPRGQRGSDNQGLTVACFQEVTTTQVRLYSSKYSKLVSGSMGGS